MPSRSVLTVDSPVLRTRCPRGHARTTPFTQLESCRPLQAVIQTTETHVHCSQNVAIRHFDTTATSNRFRMNMQRQYIILEKIFCVSICSATIDQTTTMRMSACGSIFQKSNRRYFNHNALRLADYTQSWGGLHFMTFCDPELFNKPICKNLAGNYCKL